MPLFGSRLAPVPIAAPPAAGRVAGEFAADVPRHDTAVDALAEPAPKVASEGPPKTGRARFRGGSVEVSEAWPWRKPLEDEAVGPDGINGFGGGGGAGGAGGGGNDCRPPLPPVRPSCPPPGCDECCRCCGGGGAGRCGDRRSSCHPCGTGGGGNMLARDSWLGDRFTATASRRIGLRLLALPASRRPPRNWRQRFGSASPLWAAGRRCWPLLCSEPPSEFRLLRQAPPPFPATSSLMDVTGGAGGASPLPFLPPLPFRLPFPLPLFFPPRSSEESRRTSASILPNIPASVPPTLSASLLSSKVSSSLSSSMSPFPAKAASRCRISSGSAPSQRYEVSAKLVAANTGAPVLALSGSFAVKPVGKTR
mmetsp:Transcript_33724/g.96888  ORF Transcript_33724/g.96888 Transcript_33724/m.96888 type:complete len:366 (+) Transcript_33724:190-1287(+)